MPEWPMKHLRELLHSKEVSWRRHIPLPMFLGLEKNIKTVSILIKMISRNHSRGIDQLLVGMESLSLIMEARNINRLFMTTRTK